MRFKSFIVAIALVGAAAASADAQVLTEHNVSLELAQAIAEAAIADCEADGFEVTVAVVDRSGDLKLLMRADSSNPHNADLARRKAYTARTAGVSSMDFAKRTLIPATPGPASDLSGQRQMVDVVALGGGLPIMMGTEKIGGFALSGATTQEDDEKCARVGLAAVGTIE